MGCLDGVSRLRKVNEPVRTYTEANVVDTVPNFGSVQNQDAYKNVTDMHERCAQEQTKMVVEVNEIGPENVGTSDLKYMYLDIPVSEHGEYCLKSVWTIGVGQEYE